MTVDVDWDPARHIGELRETDYTFWCWTACSCGWRSMSYRRSADAWTAHQAHHDDVWGALGD